MTRLEAESTLIPKLTGEFLDTLCHLYRVSGWSYGCDPLETEYLVRAAFTIAEQQPPSTEDLLLIECVGEL